MKIALDQALDGRKHILKEMKKAISKPRTTLAENAPKIKILKIKVDKIKEIIGPSGKVIKDICESSSSKIDIDDNGVLKIASPNDESLEIALKRINDIIVEPEKGVIYSGKVVKTVDFGAFVNFLGSKDGLVHISELQEERTNKTIGWCRRNWFDPTDCSTDADDSNRCCNSCLRRPIAATKWTNATAIVVITCTTTNSWGVYIIFLWIITTS